MLKNHSALQTIKNTVNRLKIYYHLNRKTELILQMTRNNLQIIITNNINFSSVIDTINLFEQNYSIYEKYARSNKSYKRCFQKHSATIIVLYNSLSIILKTQLAKYGLC